MAAVLALPAFAACPAPDRSTEARVARIVDGDTVRLVDGRSVRLIGIDTPEMGRKGRTDEPFAVAARDRLAVLVTANGGRVSLVYGAERQDRYGRVLAHLYDQKGRNLEEILLSEGFGRMVAIAPNTALTTCHLAAEQVARKTKAGLWRDQQVISPSAISRGGFALVKGQVTRFDRNGGGVWLEMGGELVLNVPRESIDRFGVKSLAEMKGKTIEVRGWVVDRSRSGVRKGQARWMLRLTDPGMIVVLD
ncbi:thermonuclease family protein [Pseudomonas matsuisoli]|uniref:Nuclease n=1 Tax=Pseudomonas matsuisoli TaxID=1515666 RepID=A0A917UZ34_9PSED|nr:thermonuclease family protein [Pseudomonas matsuisoli]GGJ99304.1 nuclease [Pseudomonas matsuisoli]